MLLTSDSLQQIEHQLEERGTAFSKQIRTLESTISEAANQNDVQRDSQIREAPREARRTLTQTWERTKSKRLRDLRAKLVESSAADREAILGKLKDYEASIDATLDLHKSPIQALNREGLGDAKRTEYQTQLTNAGPAELQSMADLALATDDKALAAAVLTIADRNRKRYSQFDRATFADRMVGEQVSELRHRLEVAKQKVRAMRDLDRAFVTGAESPTAKIERGLAHHRLNPSDPTEGIAASLRGQ